MRLICPNCGAQYEVDDSVIPDDGRDVQCSNCGHTWFQTAAGAQGEPDLENAVGAAPQEVGPEEAAAGETAGGEAADEKTAGGETAPAGPDGEKDAPSQGRHLDDAVLGILREEAETEARQSRQAGTLETQSDLGLEDNTDSADHRAQAVRERTARLRGTDPPTPPPQARRDLLPDIEEINSTLRATTDRKETAEAPADAPILKARRRRGARLGFGLVLLVVAAAMLAYAYAPVIVERLPQSQPYVSAYVDQVNGLRLWFDDLMKQAISTMSQGEKPPATAGATPPVQN